MHATRPRAVIGLFVAVLAILPLTATGCSDAIGSDLRISRTTDVDGDKVRVKVARGWTSLELKMRGDVTLSDDDSEVLKISEGGYLVLTLREKLKVRKVRVEPGSGGRLKYSGNAAVTDEKGRAWIAEQLPSLVEESGLWADKRARKLLDAEGIAGVLKAVQDLDHDNAKAIYLDVILEDGNPTPTDFETMHGVIAREFDSSYHAAQVLDHMLDHRVGRTVNGRSLFKAIDSLDSTYHRAQLLKPMADTVRDQDLVVYLDAVDGLDSDYHRQEVLSRLLDNGDLDEASLVSILKQVRELDSEYHATQLLSRLTRQLPESPEAREAFFDSVRHVQSEYHRQELLASVLAQNSARQDFEIMATVIDITADIGSEYHKAQLLSSAVRNKAVEDDVLLEVIDAAKTLDSSHHMSEVIGSILRRDQLSQDVLRGLLDAVKTNMNDNHRRGELLDRITDRLTI